MRIQRSGLAEATAHGRRVYGGASGAPARAPGGNRPHRSHPKRHMLGAALAVILGTAPALGAAVPADAAAPCKGQVPVGPAPSAFGVGNTRAKVGRALGAASPRGTHDGGLLFAYLKGAVDVVYAGCPTLATIVVFDFPKAPPTSVMSAAYAGVVPKDAVLAGGPVYDAKHNMEEVLYSRTLARRLPASHGDLTLALAHGAHASVVFATEAGDLDHIAKHTNTAGSSSSSAKSATAPSSTSPPASTGGTTGSSSASSPASTGGTTGSSSTSSVGGEDATPTFGEDATPTFGYDAVPREAILPSAGSSGASQSSAPKSGGASTNPRIAPVPSGAASGRPAGGGNGFIVFSGLTSTGATINTENASGAVNSSTFQLLLVQGVDPGTGRVLIPKAGGNEITTDSNPRFSLDGRRLAFVPQEADVIDLRAATGPAHALHADLALPGGAPAEWSPNGRYLAYVGGGVCVSACGSLGAMDADSGLLMVLDTRTHREELVEDAVAALCVHWRAQGGLVFSTANALYRLSPGSRTPVRLSVRTGSIAGGGQFDLSRNGTLVTWARADSAGHDQVWIAPINGSAPPRQLTRGGYDHLSPHFSPDGRFVAYVAHSRIAVVRANGSGTRVLPVEGVTAIEQWAGGPGLPAWFGLKS